MRHKLLGLSLGSLLALTGCHQAEFYHKIQCGNYGFLLLQEEEIKSKMRHDPDGYAVMSIDRVFYSKSRNSCVVIEKDQVYGSTHFFQTLTAVDALTREELWYAGYENATNSQMSLDEDELLKTYQ